MSGWRCDCQKGILRTLCLRNWKSLGQCDRRYFMSPAVHVLHEWLARSSFKNFTLRIFWYNILHNRSVLLKQSVARESGLFRCPGGWRDELKSKPDKVLEAMRCPEWGLDMIWNSIQELKPQCKRFVPYPICWLFIFAKSSTTFWFNLWVPIQAQQ